MIPTYQMNRTAMLLAYQNFQFALSPFLECHVSCKIINVIEGSKF